MPTSKARYKIWRASRDAEAGFMVTPEAAFMIGSKSAFIAASKEGLHLSGPISLITTGEQTRQAGLFIKMNDFVQMIPSTIVTPLPSILPFPPVALGISIATMMPFFLGLLG